MTNRYTGLIKCPHCNKLTEYFYADEWGEGQICDKCKKEFKMEMRFFAFKGEELSK